MQECLTRESKDGIVMVIKETIPDKEKAEKLISVIEGIRECTTKKRPLTPYTEFISKCMKEAKIKEKGLKASEVMKQCAEKWRKGERK